MNMNEWFLRRFFWLLTSIMCRIDDRQVSQIPARGPWILVTNHVNVLEIPVLYTRLRPRPISGFFAAYRLESIWMRWLLHAFGGIPVRRGEPDLRALREAVIQIRSGAIFALAPEGTRNPQGVLQRGKAGVVILAQRSGAPIQPVVHFGDVHWQQRLKHLQRVPFNIAVGRPFRIALPDQRVSGQIRQAITDEIMMQMAALLPEEYRGYYAGRHPTTQFLQYLETAEQDFKRLN